MVGVARAPAQGPASLQLPYGLVPLLPVHSTFLRDWKYEQ